MKAIFTFLFALLLLQPIYSQWQMMNSPLATPDIQKVAYHPDGYLIAITDENEVFRSDITQSNWSKVATLDKVVMSLKISPQGIIYAGIIGGFIFSTDRGATWELKQLFSDMNAYISDIEFNTLGHIFMSQYFTQGAGIWVSTDNGTNWNIYTSGLPTNGSGFMGIYIDSLDDLYIISRYSGYVYKSTDNGLTWQIISLTQIYADDIKSDSENDFYTIGGGYRIYKSSDLGVNWTQIYTGYVNSLYVDSSDNLYGINPYNFDSTYSSIIYSSDGGTTWENIGIPGIRSNDVLKLNSTIYTATQRGLQKSINFGNDWSLCFKYTDRAASVNDLLTLSNNKLLAGTSDGLFSTENNFSSWDSTLINTSVNHIKQDNFGNIYTSADYMYRSTDDGLTWEIPYSIIPASPQGVLNLSINDLGHIIIIQGYSGIPGTIALALKSTNFGVSWNYIWSLTLAGSGGCSVHSIIENTTGTVFVSYIFSTSPPGATYTQRIIKKESGSNWVTALDRKTAPNMYLFNNDLYIATISYSLATSSGILKSTDDGNTFIQLNNGLADINVTQLILKPEVFIALTGDGIYRSLDQGNWWTRLDHTGLTGTINRIYLDDNQTLYACTNNGIYVFTGELPVELLSFTATTETGRVTLNWTTASELNNQGFEIQRKSKNTEWITIGFKEGKGTTTERNDYTYTDDVAEINTSEVYYRLKQIDYDGTFTYSEEVKVSLIPFKYELSQNYPNPFNPTTTISWQSPVGRHQTIKVYDVLGNEVATLINEYKEAGSYEVEFDGSSLASGMYIYKLSSGGFTASKKMMMLK